MREAVFTHNVQNGSHGNKLLCSHSTFAFSRTGWKRSKKNAKADVRCEWTWTRKFSYDICVKLCSHLTSAFAFASNFQVWVLEQQMMVFTLNVCIWRHRSKKNANADVKCEQGLTLWRIQQYTYTPRYRLSRFITWSVHISFYFEDQLKKNVFSRIRLLLYSNI